MKKLVGLLLLGTMFTSLCSASLSIIPKDCFDDEDYCSVSDVVHSDELDRKVIRVNFFAKIDAGEYDELGILEKFLDFDNWGEYTVYLSEYSNVKAALKENSMVIVECERLDELVEYQGYQAIVNHAHYYTTAPWPLLQSEVVERVFYFEVDPIDDALFTWKFMADPAYENGDKIHFKSTDKLEKIKGIKYKTGTLSLRYDEDEDMYIAYFEVDVIPAIDVLPGIAAPHVEQGLVSVFVGIFIDN